MKNKLFKFMQGRYGIDVFSKSLLIYSLVLYVLSLVTSLFNMGTLSNLLYLLGIILLIYSYTRIFSRNIPKRYSENQKFLTWKYQTLKKVNAEKSVLAQRRYYHFYRCPSCNQRIRIPRGKGKIEISCPKCRTTFIKKS